MPAYFFDSSAFVKRFAPESGSKFVLGLLRPSAKNRFYAARITEVEVCAALVRRQRGKTISPNQAAKGLRRLRRDFPLRFTHIAITEAVIVAALRLAKTHGLRGYDAVQLAAALAANGERLGRGLSPLILVSADTELNNAAQTKGLKVENPNSYP
jgi:predicted nucleic acid-binding protein